MQELYNQRMQNALAATGVNFQRQNQLQNATAAPSTAAMISQISPVSADRSWAYANPNAGYNQQQYDAGNYQNMAAQAASKAGGGGASPWGSIAQAVGTVAPILMTAFSDKRLKSNIKPTGETLNGHKLYSYTIKPPAHKEVGVLAQEVEKTRPDAVIRDRETGFKKVNYAALAFA
jgi:hypothetical protein